MIRFIVNCGLSVSRFRTSLETGTRSVADLDLHLDFDDAFSYAFAKRAVCR